MLPTQLQNLLPLHQHQIILLHDPRQIRGNDLLPKSTVVLLQLLFVQTLRTGRNFSRPFDNIRSKHVFVSNCTNLRSHIKSLTSITFMLKQVKAVRYRHIKRASN